MASRADLDVNGVDMGFEETGDRGGIRAPEIKVQVKTWSAPRSSGPYWDFDGLTEAQFNKLAGPGFRTPRFLVVVIVPTDSPAYCSADDGQLRLSHAAYWVSLRDQDPIAAPGDKRRRRVRIPKANLLTPDSLRSLLDDDPEVGR